MKKVKKTINLVGKIAICIAKADANAACPCISYQPTMPDSVKKLSEIRLWN